MITSNPTFIAAFSEHMKEAGFTAEQTADKLYKLSLQERYQEDPEFRVEVVKRARALRGDVGELLVKHAFEKSANPMAWARLGKGLLSAVPSAAAGYLGMNNSLTSGDSDGWLGAGLGGGAAGGALGAGLMAPFKGGAGRFGKGGLLGAGAGALAGIMGRRNHHYGSGGLGVAPQTPLALEKSLTGWNRVQQMADRFRSQYEQLPGSMRDQRMEGQSLASRIERLSDQLKSVTDTAQRAKITEEINRATIRRNQLQGWYDRNKDRLLQGRDSSNRIQERSSKLLEGIAGHVDKRFQGLNEKQQQLLAARADALGKSGLDGIWGRLTTPEWYLNSVDNDSAQWDILNELMKGQVQQYKDRRFGAIPDFTDPAVMEAAKNNPGFWAWIKSLFSGGNS